MIRRYGAPYSMTAVSVVKIDINWVGKMSAIRLKIIAETKPTLKVIASIRLMVSTSFFPQNCAIRTFAPPDTPKQTIISINQSWFAIEVADSCVSPSCPIIRVSIIDTATVMRFCNAIGTAIVTRVR